MGPALIAFQTNGLVHGNGADSWQKDRPFPDHAPVGGAFINPGILHIGPQLRRFADEEGDIGIGGVAGAKV